MNYNKKTRAELIKIAQEAEKTIIELYDVINKNNIKVLTLEAKVIKDEKYYDGRYAEHLTTLELMKNQITTLENRNLIQRILNK